MSRMKADACVCLAIVVTAFAIPAANEDIELRDLDLAGWDCINHPEGTAQSQEAMERNRMKNRWPVNLSAFPIESLDTTAFLKKVREYDSGLQRKYRSVRPTLPWLLSREISQSELPLRARNGAACSSNKSRQRNRDARAQGRFQGVVSLARVMSKFPLCLTVRHEHG